MEKLTKTGLFGKEYCYASFVKIHTFVQIVIYKTYKCILLNSPYLSTWKYWFIIYFNNHTNEFFWIPDALSRIFRIYDPLKKIFVHFWPIQKEILVKLLTRPEVMKFWKKHGWSRGCGAPPNSVLWKRTPWALASLQSL